MPLKISALLSGNKPWHRLGLPGWTVSVIAIALLICAPVLFVLGSMFSDSSEVWTHLVSTVLGSYIVNSLWLILGVSSGVLILGVSTAWLVTMCRFWGSRVFEWALLLPLAAPAYLLAYTYTNMLDFFGPVQTWLRQLFGWTSVQDYWFPNVRSLWGAIAMLSLVLYPYVYLITRVAFLEQSVRTLEAARSLGCTPWRGFFTVALPLARPAIMAGLALALMETLSDFGTVEYFGVSTFTTGIYRTWLGMGERSAAAQLAACLLLFIIVLILLERWSRKQSRYYETGSSYQRIKPFSLTGGRGILALLACFLPIALGFLAPAAFLLHMTIKNAEETLDDNFWQLATNSLLLAITTAAIAMVLALVMAYGQRLVPKLGMRLAVRTAAMGYAIPGSVIAVGVLMPLGQLDNTIDSWMRATFGLSTGLLFSGTIIALVYAYLVRFLAISFNTVESSLGKIKPSLDDASRSLGYGPTLTLIKVHAPLMWGGLLTAAMLVFVDVMKELPATLIMRPFNFDTLAVRVYQYASDERLIQASAPALAIVLVGIIPVILLSLKIAKSQG
ncbi:MAG: iron ABC transporter permease [Moorea sp. SIO1F2]|uniref:ABC transporter permease n=1 Tax=unclassified Moorena TaxID=2683338 RepID=UPI0013BDF99C|nr:MULTISPECIES: iron ABC transporter permease [unclassified Moorena]NEO00352.1 iron ABC transporter permease [Moorena sp. SIO3I7]NEO05797.1 iron ABC transporter permease [Moorena sp. SIO3I8]NEO20256.1 iron ABC transporter permease [Moorena sp. SIO4A5]NEP22705.1 iron ABC transporter permease [Moorena sp. SIO3I6]NEQ56348.1 iron ABC transporter permease [Moorena sp. SIO4A1]